MEYSSSTDNIWFKILKQYKFHSTVNALLGKKKVLKSYTITFFCYYKLSLMFCFAAHLQFIYIYFIYVDESISYIAYNVMLGKCCYLLFNFSYHRNKILLNGAYQRLNCGISNCLARFRKSQKWHVHKHSVRYYVRTHMCKTK